MLRIALLRWGPADGSIIHDGTLRIPPENVIYTGSDPFMTPHTEFEQILDLEVALASGVIFKFSGEEESRIYAGSPRMSAALSTMLSSIISYWQEEGRPDKAKSWSLLYMISNAPDKADFVVEYLAGDPTWTDNTDDERSHWIRVVAAPYVVDDKSMENLQARLAI